MLLVKKRKGEERYGAQNRGGLSSESVLSAFFLAAGIGFLLLSLAGGTGPIFSQLAIIILYFGITLAVIGVSRFAEHDGLSFFKKRKVLTDESSEPEADARQRECAVTEMETLDHREQEAAEDKAPKAKTLDIAKKVMQKIAPEKHKGLEEQKEKQSARRKISQEEALYLTTQTLLAATCFFCTFFLYPITIGKSAFNYDWIDIAWLLIASCAAFAVHKWTSAKGSFQFTNLARGFHILFQILCLITAAALTVRMILGVDGLFILPFVYRCLAAYVAIIILAGIAIALIKDELLESFDYILIPVGRNGDTDSVVNPLKFLETYTGLSFKSLWSIQYIGRIFPAAVLAFVVLLLISTSFYKIEPYEEGVVYRFGSLRDGEVKPAGFHLKLPWPVDKVQIYDTKRVKYLLVGYEDRTSEDFLWGLAHSGDEHTLLLGNGNELVAVNIKAAYHIDDLYGYLTTSSNPEEILAAQIYNVLMNKTIISDLDTFLEVDRSNFSEELRRELRQFTEEARIGISIDEIIIESIHPPVEVADVYQSVVGASVKKKTTVAKAEAEALRKLKEAERNSRIVVLEAEANQTKRVSDTQYEMAVYNAAYEAYREHPETFRLSKYLNTYEKIIAGNRVYIFSPKIQGDLSEYFIYSNKNSSGLAATGTGGGAAEGDEKTGPDPVILNKLSKED